MHRDKETNSNKRFSNISLEHDGIRMFLDFQHPVSLEGMIEVLRTVRGLWR